MSNAPCVYCNLGLLVSADSVRCFLYEELLIIFIIVSQNKISEQYQNRLKTFVFIDMFHALFYLPKKWRGDLTETIGAHERLGLLEL